MPRVSKKQIVEEHVPARLTTPVFMGIVFFVGVLVIGGSIMIGRSDKGEIDITSAINEANVTNAENGTGEQVVPTNPALQDLPNGGLIPKNQQPETPPVEEPVTETVPDASLSSSTPTEEAQAVSQTENEVTTEEPTPSAESTSTE